jgi:L-iditol 2-dehydrogenase
MKAAILEENYRIAVKEVPDLRTGPEELLIETKFAGVCGSDLHSFKGIHPFRKAPVILGHELAGTVAELGKGVSGFRVGDRVTVMPLIACGKCLHCEMGKENICLNKKVPGVGGWGGTFAQYFLSKPSITFKLGEKASLEVGVLAEPLAVGIHSVFEQGKVKSGSRALILGGGTIGILTALAVKKAGAKEIVVTDLFDFNLKVTGDLCGAKTYTVKEAGLEERILKDRPEKFDVTFLCSGAPATVKQALTLTRRGGRIVVVGLFLEPVPIEPPMVSLNELEIIGSSVYNHEDFKKAVEWIDSGIFDFKKLITHILPLEKAQEALNILDEHKENVIKILLDLRQR